MRLSPCLGHLDDVTTAQFLWRPRASVPPSRTEPPQAHRHGRSDARRGCTGYPGTVLGCNRRPMPERGPLLEAERWYSRVGGDGGVCRWTHSRVHKKSFRAAHSGKHCPHENESDTGIVPLHRRRMALRIRGRDGTETHGIRCRVNSGDRPCFLAADTAAPPLLNRSTGQVVPGVSPLFLPTSRPMRGVPPGSPPARPREVRAPPAKWPKGAADSPGAGDWAMDGGLSTGLQLGGRPSTLPHRFLTHRSGPALISRAWRQMQRHEVRAH
jgi:hypothetical protein